MKRHFHRLLTAGLLSLIITTSFILSCSSGNEVQVENSNFTDEIEPAQSLVLTFSQDLVPDSLVNIWLRKAYLTFNPGIQGRFRWTEKNVLEFAPDSPFAPATDFTAELTDSILSDAPFEFSISGDREFSFHTPRLRVEPSAPVWIKNEATAGKIAVRISLDFNYPVNPADISSSLRLTADGKSVNSTTGTASPDKTISLLVPESELSGLEGKEILVSLKPGLIPAGGQTATSEELTATVICPKKEALAILSAVPDFENEETVIRVSTNQTVEENSLSPFITITPSVKFKVEKQEDGFLIQGDFTPGSNYTVKFSGRMTGLFGKMGQDTELSVSFAEPKPAIKVLNDNNLYMSSQSARTIAVKITAIPRIRVRIMKIFENNLTFFFDNIRYNDYSYDEEEGTETYTTRLSTDYIINSDRYGIIISDQTIDVSSLPKTKGVSLFQFPVPVAADVNGIYLYHINDINDTYTRKSGIIAYSDIALIAKKSPKGLTVFATSIKTAEPVSDVQISLISQNNQVIEKGKTDKNGAVELKSYLGKTTDYTPILLTALKGNDFNFMTFDESRIDLSRFETGGFRENEAGWMAFLYPERNIYRPGETIHFNAVIRDEKWKPVSEVPFSIRIVLPNGQVLTNSRFKTDSQGSFEVRQFISSASMTGKYTIEIYGGKDILLNSIPVSIEEFVPDRISVKTTLSHTLLKPGDAPTLSGLALNLFGPPAANRNYESELTILKEEISPKEFKDYTFSMNRKKDLVYAPEIRQGKTGDDGAFSEEFLIDESIKNSGLYKARFFTTVFDENGRPVNRMVSVPVSTQPVYFGIKKFDDFVGSREPLTIPLIAVDLNGKVQSGVKAKVQAVRSIWETVLIRNDWGGYRYDSRRSTRVLVENQVIINGTGTRFTFTPIESGEYEIRVSLPGAENYVAKSFYAYRYGDTQMSSFSVNPEGTVDIIADKPAYESGEKAELLFKTPFAGKLLVTVERNKLIDYFWLDTDQKSATLSLPLKDDYLPNVFVSATLFRPLDDGSLPVKAAHGISCILVGKKATKMQVSIEAPESSRSNKKQTILVKADPEKNIQVTLAVVDEGILQVKDFETPDPYAFFFQKRALSVEAYDFFALIYPDIQLKSSTGGDKYGLTKRINPLTARRTQLVSYWSGILKTNSDGEASYTIDIPQFSGELRIMALAYKDSKTGFAEKRMKVADPVVISSSLPRFMSPGDSVILPVILTNTTASAVNASVSVSVSGPVNLKNTAKQNLTIPARSELQPGFVLTSKNETGLAKVVVSVKAGNETFTETTELSVRPLSGLRKYSGAGTVSGSAQVTVNFPTGLLPGTESRNLVISQTPAIQYGKNLIDLVTYPHGCTEQTVSSAFPLLYLEEMANSLKKGALSGTRINEYVQVAISTVFSRQLYNGGISLWPGYTEADPWASVYAAHFLAEARKAGYEVPEGGFKNLMSFLSETGKSEKKRDYFYYSATSGKVQSKYQAAREVIYSLYVLALAGKQDVPSMNYHKNRTDQLSPDSRYLLACAFLLSGDQISYRNLLPKEFGGDSSSPESGDSYSSPVRDVALVLNALIESDPSSANIPVFTRLLNQNLKADHWLSTQETAFSLLALGKLASKPIPGGSVTVLSGNKELGKFNGKDLKIENPQASSVTLKGTGTGNSWYFWEAEGVPSDGIPPAEDQVLSVRRSFLTRTGSVITSGQFEQNDLIVVKITVRKPDGTRIKNIVITDLLPAGFEIENPRINPERSLDWIQDASKPDYFDVRDDRINFFTDLDGENEKVFYYMVRAVTKGSFKLGPVSADAMYVPEFRSSNGTGVISVR